MSDTKEKILMTALRLFARDGYEAVSVSAIAGELGITKGALYKHYKSKRDIFDCIVDRMYLIDSTRAQKYEVPEDTFADCPAQYVHRDIEKIKEYTLAQYEFWTSDVFASSFRKMLVLEQYRDPEMNKLYQSCIVRGPVSYMEDIFRGMISEGVLKDEDPKCLAIEFFAPLFLLIEMSDPHDEQAIKLLSDCIDRFTEHYLTRK